MARKKKMSDPVVDHEPDKVEEPANDPVVDQPAESSSANSDIEKHPKFDKFKSRGK